MPVNDISGYVLLSLPTDQIQPLGLLSFQDKTVANTTGAQINNLFVDSEVPLPLISQDYLVSSNINKSVSLEISVDSHLSLLEGLLKFLKLSATFNLQKNRSVKVNLLDARKNNVNEFELDAYINSAKLNRAAKTFIEMLQNDRLYVVTDILKCKKYSLEYADQKTTDSGLEAEAAAVGDTEAKVHTGNTGTTSSVNEGEDFITIGVRAYRIYYKKDKKTGEESYRIRKDDVIKTVLADEDFPGQLLAAETITVTT